MEDERRGALGTLDRSAAEERTTAPPRRSRPLRIGAMVLTALLAVGGLLALRATVPHARPRISITNAVGPDVAHLQTLDVRRRYDALPGRTPLPRPTLNGDVVSGALPLINGPSRAGAAKAVGLVLQRYCAHPGDLGVRVTDRSGGWWNVAGHTDGAHGSTPITVAVEWSGPSYVWSGSLRQLVTCP